MKVKIFMLALVTAALLTACSSHHQRPTMEVPTPQKRLYTLKHRLNMSDEQVIAVKPILEQEYERKTELMDAFRDGNREAMRENKQKLEDLEWDIFKQLSDHLTPEQMDIYSKLLEEEKEKMMEQMQANQGRKGGGQGKRGGGGKRGM